MLKKKQEQGKYRHVHMFIYDCSLCVSFFSLDCLSFVSNVFSDKTGTLTRNEMKFVKFIVDGKMYDIQPPTETDASRDDNILEMKEKQSAPPVGSAEYELRKMLDTATGKKTKVQ